MFAKIFMLIKQAHISVLLVTMLTHFVLFLSS